MHTRQSRVPRRLALALALVCVAALSPASVALAQNGSGVPLGSAKKLSTAPPASSGAATTTRTTARTTSTSATTTTSALSSSTGATAKQLPFSGSDVRVLVLIGGVLLLAGLALHVRTRHARAR